MSGMLGFPQSEILLLFLNRVQLPGSTINRSVKCKEKFLHRGIVKHVSLVTHYLTTLFESFVIIISLMHT